VAVDFDIEDVDVGKALEEHGDEIFAARVFVGVVRILLNFETRHGHAGRVSQTQVALSTAGLGGSDFNLSRTRPQTIIERLLLADRHDCLRTARVGGTLRVNRRKSVFS
jgi:hypothetical protein